MRQNDGSPLHYRASQLTSHISLFSEIRSFWLNSLKLARRLCSSLCGLFCNLVKKKSLWVFFFFFFPPIWQITFHPHFLFWLAVCSLSLYLISNREIMRQCRGSAKWGVPVWREFIRRGESLCCLQRGVSVSLKRNPARCGQNKPLRYVSMFTGTLWKDSTIWYARSLAGLANSRPVKVSDSTVVTHYLKPIHTHTLLLLHLMRWSSVGGVASRLRNHCLNVTHCDCI